MISKEDILAYILAMGSVRWIDLETKFVKNPKEKISKPTLASYIKELETEGLIERKTFEFGNRKETRYIVTETGKKVFENQLKDLEFKLGYLNEALKIGDYRFYLKYISDYISGIIKEGKYDTAELLEILKECKKDAITIFATLRWLKSCPWLTETEIKRLTISIIDSLYTLHYWLSELSEMFKDDDKLKKEVDITKKGVEEVIHRLQATLLVKRAFSIFRDFTT
jgi:DNA-binding HxlR family transcriptional regulator